MKRPLLPATCKVLACLAFSLCSIAGTALAETPATSAVLTASDLQRFMDDYVPAQLKRKNIPGAVITVVKDGELIFSRGYGVANVARTAPMRPETTLLRPGSISKLLTLVAVMQQVEQGKLDLDRDVNTYLDFTVPTPAGGVPVTLRRLLGHRAGFEHHLKDMIQAGTRPEPLGPWLRHALPPRLFPHGDVAAYSNYGYGLAGYIVERVSGERFDDYAKAHILAPLHMDASTFEQPVAAARLASVASAYTGAGNTPVPAFETIMPGPAGGLSSTGADMGRLMLALLNGGEHLLAPATLAKIMPTPLPGAGLPDGLLGFEVDDAAGNRFIGKHGLTSAVVSQLALLPDAHFGIFASYNSVGDAPGELLAAVAKRYFQRPPTSAAPIATENGDAQAAAGTYQITMRADSSFVRLPALMQQLRVTSAAGGGIHIDAMPGSMRETAPMLFTGADGARATFRHGADGRSYMQASMVPLAFEWQAVAWYLDKRFVLPAVLASVLLIIVTLLAWPIGALLRRRRALQFGAGPRERRAHRLVRLALLVDLLALGGTIWLADVSTDLMRMNASLDAALLVLYSVAWCAVLATPLVVAIALRFWRDRVGSTWARLHHSLIALAMTVFSYFLVTWGIAGTTLNY